MGDVISLVPRFPKLIGTKFGYVVMGRVNDLVKAKLVQTLRTRTIVHLQSVSCTSTFQISQPHFPSMQWRSIKRLNNTEHRLIRERFASAVHG